jgi:hypothetical protein
MQIPQRVNNFINRAVPSFILLASLYTALIFILPASPISMAAYSINALEYKIILSAIALPSIVVWLVAFISYAKFRDYAGLIKRTPEGIHFSKLADGATWLAWSLPIPVILGLTLGAVSTHWPGFRPTSIILGNYINLLLPLVAFVLISSATRGLINDAKLKLSLTNVRVIMFAFVSAGVIYCYFIFKQLDLTSLVSSNNPYFLPIWLIVVTLIIPYLFIWFVGILAAYELQLFSKKVHGVFYRQALRLLAAGLITVIASSIALQYINGVFPRLGYLVLSYKLVLVLLFRIVGGAGFILLAIGADRLKKIEEV